MSVVSNQWVSEKASFSTNNQGKIVRNYNHKRLVVTDSLMNSVELWNQLGYTLGQTYSNDDWAVLTNWDASIDVSSGKFKWDIDLQFSTEGTPTFENSIDPTKQRIVRTWQTVEQTMYIVRDREKAMIVNTANQPYDGGIPVTIELPTLTYEFNQFNFSGSTGTQYANSLNSDTFSGAEPETLKLKIGAKETYEGQYRFWAMRYEMSYFPFGWQPQPINAGLYQLVSGKLTRCKDRDNQDATSPMPLDHNGKQIAIASLPDAAFVNKIDFYPTMPYGNLGMPPM